MDQELWLYTVDDDYVNYLNGFDNRIVSNKENSRVFERKYLGTVLKVNDIDYFVPLASPKNSDYQTDKAGNRQIRRSIVPIMRIVYKEINGVSTLIGTLKFSNMIPVLDSVVTKYDVKNETDLAYQNLVYKEWEFIRSRKADIFKNARTIYSQKTKSVQGIGYLDNTVDFLLLEEKAKLYVKNNKCEIDE